MESFLMHPEETIKFRIRRNQRRAMSVGIFYWVGILLLLCFSIFPYVGGLNGFEEATNGELWIITFFGPINAFLSAGTMTSNVLLPFLLSILYILYLLISVVTAIVGTTRLFRITKRNPTNKWGYNRAARAMKIMGKCFSLMFFMMVTILVLGVLLLDGRPTLFFYLAFGVALFFHFIGNFRACKVSFFETTDDRFNPIERKNTLTRKIGLGRNILQMVCICLILLLMDQLIMYDVAIFSFFKILDGVEQSLFDELLIPLILLVMMISLLTAVAHATGGAEYCRYGEQVRGKRTCKNSAYTIAGLALISSVLSLVSGVIHANATQNLIGIFFIAVQWIIAETMFVTLSTKQETKTEKEKAAKEKKVKPEKVKKEKPVKEKKVKPVKVKKEKPVKEKKVKPEKVKKVKPEKVQNLAQSTGNIITDEAPEVALEAIKIPQVEAVVEEVSAPVYEYDEKVEALKKQWHAAEEEKVEQPSTPISTSIFAPTVDNAPLFGDAMRTTPEFVSMDNAVNFDSNAFSFAPETPVVEEVVEEVEEEVEEENEETLGGNIAEDDPELAELRKKWLAKYDDIADHAPIHDTRLLTEQQVHCPRCNTLLHVRFGWTKAKCSKCGAIFELRKRSQDYFNH